MRNHFRRGRRNIRAGQEEANCRPITYEEREKIWRDAVKRENATRKKGCANGELGKAGLAVLHSLLFDFMNMKTGVQLFGGARLYWYFDAESLDKMTQLNATMMQDREYIQMLDKVRDHLVDGSLKDTIVTLIG